MRGSLEKNLCGLRRNFHREYVFVQELVASKCPAALFARAVLAIDGEISFFMHQCFTHLYQWRFGKTFSAFIQCVCGSRERVASQDLVFWTMGKR